MNNNQFNVMDVSSLFTSKQPQDLFTLNYSGVLSPTVFFEARYSKRNLILSGLGSPFQDIINGTMVRDLIGGTRYWTSTFCGVCRDEDRDNNDIFLKGNYFLSRKGSGSHNIVFGYDRFNDIRASDNYQSGSSYRIIGTTTVVRGTTVYPQFLTTGANRTLLQYDPITLHTQGTAFQTHSLFVNDNVRWSNNVTFNLGLRWDKNHGEDGQGTLTARDSAFSPRVGVVWDPKGNGEWAVTASFAKYVSAIANTIADSSSQAGAPASYQWAYNGPAINPDSNAATLVDTASAIQTVFNACGRDANGFCTTMGPTVNSQVPGVGLKIPNGLESPHVNEFAAGVSRQLGSRAAIRADYVFRNYRDFYSTRIDQSTGRAVDSLGNPTDIGITENTNDLKRRYQGLQLSVTYRVSARTDIGGNYTLSRLWGNFDGEDTTSGPVRATNFQYPELRQASWYAPEGDLAADQRHRSRLWINYGVPKIPQLTVSFLESLSSGVPYGAVGSVDARPYVSPAVLAAYVTPQGGTSETYYYTARDAFRTDSEFRTDMSATLNHSLNWGVAQAGSLHPDARAERLQPVPALWLWRFGVQQRRADPVDPHQHRREQPERRDASELQPLHADAGAGRELGFGSRVRHGDKSNGVYTAARVPGHVRRAILRQVGQGGRGYPAFPALSAPSVLLRPPRSTATITIANVAATATKLAPKSSRVR